LVICVNNILGNDAYLPLKLSSHPQMFPKSKIYDSGLSTESSSRFR
jgi:hypothetical protein